MSERYGFCVFLDQFSDALRFYEFIAFGLNMGQCAQYADIAPAANDEGKEKGPGEHETPGP